MGEMHEKDLRGTSSEGIDHARSGAAKDSAKTPAAGPHAKPSLTAPEKTPGTGSLPDPDRPQDGDATTG